MSQRPEQSSDDEMAAPFERIIRRVKSSMSYRGSYSTRDILGSLVARWLQSGEWQRLKLLPPAERHIGEQVGQALRLHTSGHTQRQIAADLGVSLGATNKRILEGNYLVVLRGIESGPGGRE